MADRFVGWWRSPVFGAAKSGVVEGGRLQAELPVTLEDLDNPADTRGGATPFELLGPGDVAGLVPAAITARVPPPGQQDALETKAVHVEFAAEDLPWRYTPATAAPAAGLRPWLVLVVGLPGSEVVLRRDGTVQLKSGALGQHRLSESHRWAHVHDLGSRRIARVLSPRDLEKDTDYVAVLVPAFALQGDDPSPALADAWDGITTSVVLPCYDWWTFRTGPAGDFADLAAKLTPVDAADIPGFAVASIRYDPLDRTRQFSELAVSGALMRVPLPGETAPDAGAVDPAIATEVNGLVAIERRCQGRWVLAPPLYDEPWPGADTLGWRRELRSDPRRRGVAGLGAWAGIAWQQRIADAAAAQAGALAIAAQRIRHLTLGLAVTRSLWTRRLPPAADPVARLVVLAPLLGRLPADRGSVLDAVDGRTPRFSAALFSSAAQRVLRPGPARTALARPGASRLASVLDAVNRCPEPERPDDLGRRLRDRPLDRPDADAFREIVDEARRRAGDRRPTLDALLAQLPGWLQEGLRPPPPGLLAALDPGGDAPPDLDALREEVNRLRDAELPPPDDDFRRTLDAVFRREEPAVPCRPIDLAELGRRVVAAVDPTVDRPLVVDRVLGTITGLKEPRLAPPELSPELDLPMWKFLDEYTRDWLLPGVADLPLHSVVAVQSNPVFVDAFLAGANHQTLGELRWRNIPIEARWTPLRRFWERITYAGGGAPATDIRPILEWPGPSALGAVSHQVNPADGTQLVVVFHTALFRRFPATVVYLTSAKDAAGNPVWATTPDTDAPTVARVHPTMTGSVGPDVVFFGFPVPPAAGRDHWVVLEEPPPGHRFYTKNQGDDPCEDAARAAKKSAAQNGAAYAEATYALPVRVFLGKLLP